ADVLRVERGRPRYGIDLDDTVIPQEADLNARAVSFTKGCYVGQETVARLFYRGKPNRQLRGLRLSEPAFIGAEINFGERTVGRHMCSKVPDSPVTTQSRRHDGLEPIEVVVEEATIDQPGPRQTEAVEFWFGGMASQEEARPNMRRFEHAI